MIVFRLDWVESWIVKLRNFIMDSALKTEQHISKSPTNKDLSFVTVPFSLLRWHLLDTSATPCTCSKAKNKLLKMSGKKTSNYKREGKFSHIKRLLMTCEVLVCFHIMRKIERFSLVMSTYSESCITENSWDEHLENHVSVQHIYWIRNTFSFRRR